ncbi:MAG: DUF4231 domain-containing protein [Methylococcaceae bacterium]|nr:DUF4231 domain-containing protein [Methylococcaceae bacterium]
MNEKEYIEQRLQDQIDWYERKSQSAHQWYRLLRGLEIIAASTIPFLAGYSEKYVFVTPAVGLLGLLIAVIAGLLSLNQYQERWVEYRSNCEMLKQEKYLFLTRSEPYSGDQPFALLVQRVENQLNRENSQWVQLSKAEEKQGGN